MSHSEIEQLKMYIDKKLDEKLDPMIEQHDEMYKIFSGVSKFGDISTFILKAIILIGTAIGVIYGFFYWLRHS